MENNYSLSDKVDFLIRKSISKKYTKNELKNIIEFTRIHSDDLILGKFFGFSVSDYAFATLKWIGNDETIGLFDKLSAKLNSERLSTVNKLINMELYKQY